MISSEGFISGPGRVWMFYQGGDGQRKSAAVLAKLRCDHAPKAVIIGDGER